MGAGAFATACLREDCSSLLTASATYQLHIPGGSSDTGQLVLYGASIVHGVSPHVKVLAEVASATASIVGDSFDNFPGALASYGIRFHNSALATDVGFMKPLLSDGSDELLLGLPFINVSYRWE